ncbi:aberrant root formation protein 4-like [Chenopodium quinoa]|uniref:aberrant root formation protein 4-like n=1 Tax=Chenopodium quinoa TaxID=63459 RepID=UPI000B78AEC1|nr:aberrant root formation protein 4-like [Chenopodium quinoa]XP_021769412.1 aberrant root formation protein 4-like [Chenopodium quinoa]
MSAPSEETSTASPSSQPLILRLQQFLDSCSKAVEDGDIRQSEEVISGTVEFLSSISDAAISDPDDEGNRNNSIVVLTHIHSFLSNPSLDQAIVDALSFEMPKAIAKFAGVSQRCREIVESVIDHFTTKCSPRDMISVFSEALDSYGKTTDASGYVSALLRGVSKAFLSISRRQAEQIKVALPIILNAVKAASFDLDDRDIGFKDLFEGAISIANSMLGTCKKLEDGANGQLRGLLSLYVMQIMTVVSISAGDEVSSSLSFVQTLSSFFPYCGLSYADLVCGLGVDPLINLIRGDEMDDYMDCFCYVKHGAVLSMIWGHISDEVSQAAGQDVSLLKNDLRTSQSRRWSTIGMMKYIFSLGELPWVLKKHATDFLLVITENSKQDVNEDMICSSFTPSLISTLQAILSVIMYAPDAELRKMAFATLKRVLADNPASLRLDIMQVLVKSSTSSSMVAILLDCVRENLRNDYLKLREEKVSSSCTFWNASILELVEFVLRPPNGGPPSLPEQSDAVLSALNLYRYVLIAEKTGNTNYTGVVSRNKLEEVYRKWLLPLRTLVMSINAENKNGDEQLATDIMCGLNPLELVLYHCIELVE